MSKSPLAPKKSNEIERSSDSQEIILSEKNGNEKIVKDQVNSDETQEDENENKAINYDKLMENVLSRLKGLEEKEQKNNERINNLKQENTKINERINNLEQENTKENEGINNLEQDINNLNQENTKINERINNLEQKINNLKQENTKRKNEILRLNFILGKIQIRGMAKNFLKSFNKYLSNDEKIQIKGNPKKRGESILKAFRREFSKYKEKSNYQIIEEIIMKSGNVLNEGNCDVHTINLDNYSEELIPFKNRLNIKDDDKDKLEKVFYLLKIRVENDSFENCFGFLEAYYEKN